MNSGTRQVQMLVLALAALLVFPGSATAQFEGLRRHIEQILESDGIPSITVAVARNGRILWEEGFGWADRASRIPATPHVEYSLASLTKPLTATGLMVLAERGLLQLDDPVNQYLGDAGLEARIGDVREVTIRRLANHTAGLPDHARYFYRDEPDGPPPAAELIRRHGIVVNVPGERLYYTNLDYGVLGYLISRVAGKSFADYMRNEVFLPLGMTESSIGPPDGSESAVAVRYYPNGAPWPSYRTDTPGAMGGYSSAHDLIRFALFHLKHTAPGQRPILSHAVIDAMRQPTHSGSPDGEFGIGWSVERLPGRPLRISHFGGMPGVTTSLTMYPEEDLAIVVLSNVNTSRVAELQEMILQAMLDTTDRGGGRTVPSQPGQAAQAFRPSSQLAGRWRGEVEVGDQVWPIELDIRPDGDVHLRINGELWTVLNRVTFRDGVLRGFAPPGHWTSVPYRKAFRRRLDLTLRGNVLYGSLALYEASVHTTRSDSVLSYWVKLTKEDQAAP